MSKDQKEVLKDPMKLQQEINKHLPNKNDKDTFHLSELYERIKKFVFHKPSMLFNINNFFDLVKEKFVDKHTHLNYVLDNNKNYIKLTSPDLIFIIKKLFNEMIILQSEVCNPYLIIATENEMIANINNHKNKPIKELRDIIKNSFTALKKNIKWLSTEIIPDDEIIVNFIEDLYL